MLLMTTSKFSAPLPVRTPTAFFIFDDDLLHRGWVMELNADIGAEFSQRPGDAYHAAGGIVGAFHDFHMSDHVEGCRRQVGLEPL